MLGTVCKFLFCFYPLLSYWIPKFDKNNTRSKICLVLILFYKNKNKMS